MKANDSTVIGSSRRDLARRGVSLRPRLAHTNGQMVGFDDGTTAAADSIVWATGFTVDDTWVDIPVSSTPTGDSFSGAAS